MTRVEEIKARCEAATKGPWRAKPRPNPERCDGIAPDYHNHDAAIDCYEADDYGGCPYITEIVTTDSGVYGPRWPDAEFIAHAREDLPYLLDQVAALSAELQLVRRYAQHTDSCDLLQSMVEKCTCGLADLLTRETQK